VLDNYKKNKKNKENNMVATSKTHSPGKDNKVGSHKKKISSEKNTNSLKKESKEEVKAEKAKPVLGIHRLFKPNLTPKQVFENGAFGGTYWRPIDHKGTLLKDQHKKYDWGLPDKVLTKAWKNYDVKVNKYGVSCGTTLEFWRESGWITDYDPYGWFQWYCEYNSGRRCADDERQINRWLNLCGPKGRFRKS